VGTDDVHARSGWRPSARAQLLGSLALVPALLGGMISTATAAGAAPAGAAPHAASVIQDVLLAVACPAATDCVAVGYSGTPHSQAALIELWNGKSWQAVAAPLPKNTFSSSLDGISCTSGSECTAVGDALNVKTGFIEPLIVKGSGSAWSVVPNPGLEAGSGAMLDSVSCASATACLAVGENLTGAGLARAEQWNGKRWVTLSPPSPSNSTTVGLDDVSCSAAAACMVVGFYQLGGDELTLAEAWNGKQWTIDQTPGGSQAAFASVSCVSAAACIAVGESATATTSQVAFAASWNGKAWTATAAKAPAGRVTPELDGVSCTSASACIAVGMTSQDTIVNPTEAPLAETWNGSAWTLVDPAASAHGSQVLSAVGTAGRSTAIAVGNAENVITGEQQTLAERWSGTAWTALSTPNP
jgi:hypothetical protein